MDAIQCTSIGIYKVLNTRMAVSLQTHALIKRGGDGSLEKEAVTTAWHSEAMVPIQYYRR